MRLYTQDGEQIEQVAFNINDCCNTDNLRKVAKFLTEAADYIDDQDMCAEHGWHRHMTDYDEDFDVVVSV